MQTYARELMRTWLRSNAYEAMRIWLVPTVEICPCPTVLALGAKDGQREGTRVGEDEDTRGEEELPARQRRVTRCKPWQARWERGRWRCKG